MWHCCFNSSGVAGPRFGPKRPATGRNEARQEGITPSFKELKNNTPWYRRRRDGTAAVEFQDRCRKTVWPSSQDRSRRGLIGSQSRSYQGVLSPLVAHLRGTDAGPPALGSLRHSSGSASTKLGFRKPRRLSPSIWASAMSWVASASLKSGFWCIRFLKFFGSFIPIAV